MKIMLRSMLLVVVALPVWAGVVEDSGVQGGIVIQLGITDGQHLADLRVNERYLVHGLDQNIARVDSARTWLRDRGLYGVVTADTWDGRSLPYVDRLVNLVLADAPVSELLRQEIDRVLAPGGVVLVDGHKTVKPWPSDIDEWTHYLHGPDNNAVANDTTVAAPKSIQWVSSPRWARSHEQLASMSAAVSARGRVFFIFDEAPLESIRYTGHWKLIARDAFNGTLLWKRDIPLWSDHLRHFRAGPVHLPRRLVAVGDRVFVTLGLDAPVSVLDAATGETLQVLTGTEHTEEITVADGMLYLVAGTSEAHRKGSGDSFYERNEPAATDFRYLAALDVESGEQIWRKEFTGTDFLLPTSMTVHDGSVYYRDLDGVGRLDAKTGEEQWETKRLAVASRMAYASPTVVATDEVLLVADRVPNEKAKTPAAGAAKDKVTWGIHGWNMEGFSRKAPCKLVAYSVDGGEALWEIPCKEQYNAAVDVFVVDDAVYVGSNWARYDLKTGAPRAAFQATGGKVGMAHHRCYRNKASVNYLFTGRSGIEVASLEDGWLGNNSWIRGTCQYGIMPANGMLYAPPDACGCFNKVKVQGFFAAAPERTPRQVDVVGRKSDKRLVKGPAYGRVDVSSTPGTEDWPTFRANGARSGSVETTVASRLKKTWTKALTGRLTQPVCAGDLVVVAEIDTHTVHALNALDGSVKWSFTAGGRIDSPPTIFQGMVLFGSADGRVRALRATDGAVCWTFLAAPDDQRVTSYGQLESVWPVHGSVLIQGDAAYVAAGRNSYLDGGIVLYKLNPCTGDILQQNVLSNFDPETGKQLGVEARFDMEGVDTDLLSGDGENVFMKQVRLTADLAKGAKDAPHLFGIHGFLGEEWFVRSYWLMGTDVRAGWGGWASGNETIFGRILAFDESQVFGYGRTAIKAGAVGHKEETYHLFASEKVLMPTGAQASKPKKKSPKPKKPEPLWSSRDSLVVRAMVLTDDKLIVAGPPDLRKKDANLLAYTNEEESLAVIRGEKGVHLRIIQSANGETLSENTLESMPVFDGISAARGRVFLSLQNGSLQCWQ